MAGEKERDDKGALRTRREFIRGLVLKTAYTAPLIATFTIADVASGKKLWNGKMMSSMMMMMRISPMGKKRRRRRRRRGSGKFW